MALLVTLLLTLLTLLTSTLASVDCRNTSSIEALTAASLVLCETSTRCERRFYLRVDEDVDEPLFHYLLERALIETRVDVQRPLSALCSNESSQNATMNTEAASLWLLFLENYSFCTENEVPDLVHGCVCRRNKVCHEEPGSELALGTATYVVLLITFIGIVLYYGVENARAIASLRRDYERKGLIPTTQQPTQRRRDASNLLSMPR